MYLRYTNKILERAVSSVSLDTVSKILPNPDYEYLIVIFPSFVATQTQSAVDYEYNGTMNDIMYRFARY